MLRAERIINETPYIAKRNFYLAVLFGLFHLARAASVAIFLLADAESFLALALPPFNPPSRPRATAAGFFCGFSTGMGCPVDWLTIRAAIWFTSGSTGFFLDRLGMAGTCHNSQGLGSRFLHRPFQNVPVPTRIRLGGR